MIANRFILVRSVYRFVDENFNVFKTSISSLRLNLNLPYNIPDLKSLMLKSIEKIDNLNTVPTNREEKGKSITYFYNKIKTEKEGN
jgi:hypothetical protein